MSNIQLPIAELKPALAGLGKIISRHSTLPALKMVKIERTKDGWVTLTSSDLDSFISVRLEEPTQGPPVQVLVAHEDLNRITKKCQKNESITISREGDKALVQYPIGNQTGEEHLESLPAAEFPAFPEVKGESTPIHEDLRDSILEAFQCASTDETRIILNGVYLDVDVPRQHHLVSTDGRHLYSTNAFSVNAEKSLIIPYHKLLEWREFSRDGEWELTFDKTLLQICTRRWTFITKLIEGNYPNWRQVVPKDDQFNTTVELSPAAVEGILALVPRIPCHDIINNPIGLIIEKKGMMLRGRGANDSKWTDLDVEGVTVRGMPVTVYLNRHFLTKALKFGMSTIELIDPLTPLKFSNGGKQMVVMPIRATDPAQAAEPAPTHAEEPSGNDEVSPPHSEANQLSPHGDTSTERMADMPRTSSTNGHSNGNGTTNGNGAHETKSTLDTAFEQIETIKGSYREAIRGLSTLTDTLKQVQRDQKTNDREVQNVRLTLEKLQSVRI